MNRSSWRFCSWAVQLLSLGILGSYIGRIFKEVKGRPLYVVRRTYGLESPPGA